MFHNKKWHNIPNRKRYPRNKARIVFMCIFFIFIYFFLSYWLIRVFEKDLNLYEKFQNLKFLNKFNQSETSQIYKGIKPRINIFTYVEPKPCNGTCFGENGEATLLTVSFSIA